ncbi:MAG: DNA polymerase III subunit beta [Gammaproteobacteria bacterium]|nr:DNA polymerase III subunit beta [Gammaproteobacteria bacterium]
MICLISRNQLLKPLQLVGGVVERHQTIPILSNLLLKIENQQLSVTSTDMEIEMVAYATMLEGSSDSGSITIPAKKFSDICRTLPEGADIKLSCDASKATMQSGRSRFTLSTLPAADFPNVETSPDNLTFQLSQRKLKFLIDSTLFAVAHQDVRYYLNGLLLEVKKDFVRAVATDGHRLALSECDSSIDISSDSIQIIVPRKGVTELSRLLVGDDDIELHLAISGNHISISTDEYSFKSKLIDGRFPDYQRVIPEGGDKVVIVERDLLRQALQRASILSSEKLRGVQFQFSQGELTISAHNPEQEQAEETLEIEYAGDRLEIGFNVNYVLDALAALKAEKVKLTLLDGNSSCLIEGLDSEMVSRYVVMPMRF